MNKAKVTVAQVAAASINIFASDCMAVAKENWCQSQVDMLERLFTCVSRGCDYKCVGCTYFGKTSDAPENNPDDCMWQPGGEDGFEKPCEGDEEY